MPCAGGAEKTVRTECAVGGNFAVHGSRASTGLLRVLAGIVAIGAVACPPAHAADPQRYAIVDSLFLQRTNEASERPLVVDRGDLRVRGGSRSGARTGHAGWGRYGPEVLLETV